ncbi:hypothetical protein QYF61_015200 [Mycteria americana]|uniref:Uncharacterized protein n=1 Tax=Mycteria americana TaxID=33587 RepID=A0AAN7RU32_MYCAM|nr:hypothetical protein QYF61_015200 [Mycteria americana]
MQQTYHLLLWAQPGWVSSLKLSDQSLVGPRQVPLGWRPEIRKGLGAAAVLRSMEQQRHAAKGTQTHNPPGQVTLPGWKELEGTVDTRCSMSQQRSLPADKANPVLENTKTTEELIWASSHITWVMGISQIISQYRKDINLLERV